MANALTKEDLVAKARVLIARRDERWLYYCASIDQIPDNIAGRAGVCREFAEYCWPYEWEAAT